MIAHPHNNNNNRNKNNTKMATTPKNKRASIQSALPFCGNATFNHKKKFIENEIHLVDSGIQLHILGLAVGWLVGTCILRCLRLLF